MHELAAAESVVVQQHSVQPFVPKNQTFGNYAHGSALVPANLTNLCSAAHRVQMHGPRIAPGHASLHVSTLQYTSRVHRLLPTATRVCTSHSVCGIVPGKQF